MSKVESLTDATFEAFVRQPDREVLVDFWAPWCGPCRVQGPAFERTAEHHPGQVQFAKVNVDEAPTLARSLGITGIPTLALFRDGKLVEARVGVQSEAVLAKWLQGESSRLLAG